MDAHRPGARLEAPVKGNQGRRRPPRMSVIGTFSDIQPAPTNVRFWGKADIDQPPLTKLDL